MTTPEAPTDGQRRSVSIVAPLATSEALRAAILDEPSLHVVATAPRFVDLVRAKEFPGDVVVLAEDAGRQLLAHARTAIVAGAMVVVHAATDSAMLEELEATGAVVVPATEPIASVVGEAASERHRSHRGRARHAPDAAEHRPRLSHSERRALAHYVQGHSTVQVAAEMGVGYETAKTFLRRVRAKYAAVDRPAGKRSELITRAEEDGIL